MVDQGLTEETPTNRWRTLWSAFWRSRWWPLTMGLVAVWILMGAVVEGPGQLPLEFAGTGDEVREVLADYGRQGGLDEVRRELVIDTVLLVPLYVAWSIVSIEVARRRFYVISVAKRIGGTLAVAVAVAGVFDVIENVLIFRELSGSVNDGLAAAVNGFALAKWTALVMVVAYVGPALIGFGWRHRTAVPIETVVFSVVYALLSPVLWLTARLCRCEMMTRVEFIRGLRVQNLTRPAEPDGEAISEAPEVTEDMELLGPEQATMVKRVKPTDDETLGICFSGGGIRSASFALGALQKLQSQGVIGKARYLSAVSGGGYLAGSYEMVRSRGLFQSTPNLEPPPLAPGTPEEHWIRNRSAFLAHTAGQKARLVSKLFLGIGVNALFLFALLYVFLRPIGWFLDSQVPELVSRGTTSDLVIPLAHWLTFAIPAIGAVLAGFLAVTPKIVGEGGGHDSALVLGRAMVFVALGALVALIVLPVAVFLIFEWIPILWNWLTELVTDDSGTASQETVRIVSLLGTGGALAFLTTAVKKQLEGATPTLWAAIGALVVVPALVMWALAAVVFGALDEGLSGTMSPFGAFEVAEPLAWAMILGLLALFWLVSDQRAWSMHVFYKRRLHRAFAMERTSDLAARELSFDVPHEFSSGTLPEFISCAAANVTDYAVVAPGLRAVSFTFGAGSIGSSVRKIDFMDLSGYSSLMDPKARRLDTTVPAAMAISGAAISPAMGKETRPWLTALMALANVRLGVWMPNPRWVQARVTRVDELRSSIAALEEAPSEGGRARDLKRTRLELEAEEELWWERPRVSYLLKEMFGMHSLDDRFLYVTDGGHYDVLGLVELLRRGCTRIFVFDASGGQPGTFSSMGDAMALAQAELGLQVDLPLHDIRPADAAAADQYEERRLELPWRSRRAGDRGGVLVAQPYAWGTFSESGVERGTICYVQAAVSEGAPWQVRSYWESDPRFPNHSTGDQDFDHREFEAYRALGYWAAGEALEAESP